MFKQLVVLSNCSKPDSLDLEQHLHFFLSCLFYGFFHGGVFCGVTLLYCNEATIVKHEDVLTALRGNMVAIVNFKRNSQIEASSDCKDQVYQNSGMQHHA